MSLTILLALALDACSLTAVEKAAIGHYLAWGGSRPGSSMQEDQPTRSEHLEIVRSGDRLYVHLPVRALRKNPIHKIESVLVVDNSLIPYMSAYDWNPDLYRDSFESYVGKQQGATGPICRTQLRLPPVPVWRPSSTADKAELLSAMRAEAIAYRDDHGETWDIMNVSDFNVADPEVHTVLEDSRTGQFMLGVFSVNRAMTGKVSLDRLAGTDLTRLRLRPTRHVE